MNRPAVLLLDEPLGALDLKLRQQMQHELRTIQGEVGITFVYVTHDQEEALTMSDRLAVFNNGRIEQVGAPADVYEHPLNEFVAGFVGVSNIVERGGRRVTIRPEKVRILDTLEHAGDFEVEEGRIQEVSYAGMITRFVVALDRGGRAAGGPAEPRDVLAGGARAERAAGAGRLGRRARVRHPGGRNNRGGTVREHRWRWWTGLAALTLALAGLTAAGCGDDDDDGDGGSAPSRTRCRRSARARGR